MTLLSWKMSCFEAFSSASFCMLAMWSDSLGSPHACKSACKASTPGGGAFAAAGAALWVFGVVLRACSVCLNLFRLTHQVLLLGQLVLLLDLIEFLGCFLQCLFGLGSCVVLCLALALHCLHHWHPTGPDAGHEATTHAIANGAARRLRRRSRTNPWRREEQSTTCMHRCLGCKHRPAQSHITPELRRQVRNQRS